MKSMTKTFRRIKAQCDRHEHRCDNCIFMTTSKGVLDREYSLFPSNCIIKRAFEYCFLKGGEDILPPSDWDIDSLEKELDERSI